MAQGGPEVFQGLVLLLELPNPPSYLDGLAVFADLRAAVAGKSAGARGLAFLSSSAQGRILDPGLFGGLLDGRVAAEDHLGGGYLGLPVMPLSPSGHFEHLPLLTWCPENLTLSIENRARFVCEIIQGIKEACGADSLETRLGPYGYHPAEFAGDLYFSGYGIDGNTGWGTQFDFDRRWGGLLDGEHSGCGLMLDVAAKFKEALNIPVGCVTYMDPAHAPTSSRRP